jgi:SAM-dependent methyltransferase
MPTTTARYDGVADWYDVHLLPGAQVRRTIERLLGRGPGHLLDLGCGTGFHLETLARLGWAVTGVDISEDQLRIARQRGGDSAELLQADAAELPFEDARFDAALSTFTHTDVGDFAPVLAEAARVLRPSAPLVYLGLHPCFVGPHSGFVEAKGLPTLHAGYTTAGRYERAPGISPRGLRAKVGAVHLPLGAFLQSFLDAGFAFERIEECDPTAEGREYPHWLALRAQRR